VTKRLTGTLLIAVMCFFNPAIKAQDKIKPIILSEVTGNAPEETKKEIVKLEEEHSKAVYDQDTAALERMLADGWAYTNERGEVLSKQQWIANIKSRKFGMDTTIHDQIRIDQFGDTVVVMGRSTSTLHYRGKTSTGPRRFELVFAKVGGEWKVVGHFVSLVPHD
jgi:ketosteroid isomerase-like protein